MQSRQSCCRFRSIEGGDRQLGLILALRTKASSKYSLRSNARLTGYTTDIQVWIDNGAILVHVFRPS